jgi:hypothetical protein
VLKPLVSIVNSQLHNDALIRVRRPRVLKKAAPTDAVIAMKADLSDRTIVHQLAVMNDAMFAAMHVLNEDLARNVPNVKKLRQLLHRAAEMTIHTGRNLMSGFGTTKLRRRSSQLLL